MSGEGAKLSFSLGGASNSNVGPSTQPANGGMSNMAMLLAQAKAKSGANGNTAAASSKTAKPFVKKPASNIFGDDDDEQPQHAGPSLAGPSKPRATVQSTQMKEKKLMSKAERKAQEEALKIDATVFDYDGVYDGMKAAEKKVEEAKKTETAERKPKYIDSFLASAQTRKLDRLRAEEKMLQLEREKEGDEFADKEKFVTEAYKRQMEEVRKAEEEEKKREEELRKSKKGPGLSAFYQSMLNDESARHDAAVAASHGLTDSGPSLAIRPPTQQQEQFDDVEEYDPLLAQEERHTRRSAPSNRPLDDKPEEKSPKRNADGAEINEEGEVIDKRTLLKAGLNIMKKPQPQLPNSLLSGSKSENLEGPYKSRAVGTAASYTERMARERKRLAEEMRLDQERKRQAEEEAARAEEEAARRRREGDDGDAQRKREEAKRRFLERKRAREAEDEEKRKKKSKEE